MKDKKVFKIIVFLVVLLIPLIYSFFYLKSYWNPYGNLVDMKVAIVNLDNGCDGTNQGKKLTDELVAKDVLDFCVVSENDAKKGLENNEYYAVITIPSNFSENLASASTDNKQAAKIIYTPNQQKNYLASQIINKVVTATESSLESKVSKEVVGTLTDTLNTVPDKMQDISDGAKQISDGADKLNDGLNELSSGVSLLNEKYGEFDQGVKSAYSGSETLNNGVSAVDNGLSEISNGSNKLNAAIEEINNGVGLIESTGSEKIGELTQGIDQLSQGASQLNAGVAAYVDGADAIFAGIQSYTSGVATIDSNEDALMNSLIQYDAAINSTTVTNPQVNALANSAKQILAAKSQYKLDEAGQKLSVGASQLSANSATIKAGASNLNAGMTQLKEGSNQLTVFMSKIGVLKSGLSSVEAGTNTLSSGVSELKNGTSKLQVGSEQLSNGLSLLSTNSTVVKESLQKLDDGSKSAADGSKELANGVDTLKTEVDKGIENTKQDLTKLNNLNDYVENPVQIEEVAYGEVSSYGVAFTPLFISIGLWVGALMCYVVLYYDQRHRFGKFDSSEKNKILQNVLYVVVGIVEGIVTGLALKTGLHFEVVNMGTYLIECAAVGAVFMTIIQFLIRNLGDIGKFLALIILVLQLAASGGTFPVETIDKGFRFLNPLLPMTYTINIFKECLIDTNTHLMGNNTFVIVSLAVVLFSITMVVDIIKNKNMKNKKNA